MQSLGAAFQKVNFLRDMSADYKILSRSYFPGVDFSNFTPEIKGQTLIVARAGVRNRLNLIGNERSYISR